MNSLCPAGGRWISISRATFDLPFRCWQLDSLGGPLQSSKFKVERIDALRGHAMPCPLRGRLGTSVEACFKMPHWQGVEPGLHFQDIVLCVRIVRNVHEILHLWWVDLL